jgi:hypothetical protein
MGYTRFRQLVRKARPFFWRRDHDAAQPLVRRDVGSMEDERLLALLGALKDYRTQRPVSGVTREVEWAECVFVPVLDIEGQPQSR